MKKAYIEGIGGVEVSSKEVNFKTGLQGKDVLYITDKFELSSDKRSHMFVESEEGPIFIHISTDSFKKVGTSRVEPAAITALRGAMSKIKKEGYYAFVYEGIKNNNPVHYVFIASSTHIKKMFIVKSGKLSIAIKKIGSINSVVFLNNFEGDLEELKAFKQGIGLSVFEPREKGISREDFIYDGILAGDNLLPVLSGAKKGKTAIESVEDKEIIKSVYKGLGIVAVCAAIGLIFEILAVPYMKAIPYMQPQQESKVDYVAIVNDYGKLFEAVPSSNIYSKLSELATTIAKFGLEPLSYDISESSITAHIRTRDMKKALAFRKNFKGECSDIEKEGPYYNFSVTIGGGNGS